jgi:hypothetical protein
VAARSEVRVSDGDRGVCRRGATHVLVERMGAAGGSCAPPADFAGGFFQEHAKLQRDPTSGRAARQLRAAPASQAWPACPSHMRELPRITGAAREWGDGRARGSEFPNTSPATTRFGWRADSGRELRSVGHEGQVQVPARGGSCRGAEAPEERGTCRQGERPRGNQLKRCHARGASGIADSTPRRHALTGTDRCWPPCRSSGQPARPPCPRSAYG